MLCRWQYHKTLCVALLEDLLLQAPLVTGSLFMKVAQVSGCSCSDRVEGHSRLISSWVDGYSPWVSGFSVYRFLELHRWRELKCKITLFHPLLLFIIFKRTGKFLLRFHSCWVVLLQSFVVCSTLGEASCFLKKHKIIGTSLMVQWLRCFPCKQCGFDPWLGN